MGDYDSDKLRVWRDDAVSARDTILGELGEFQKKARAAEQRVRLFDDLLALEGVSPDANVQVPGQSPIGDALIDAVERIIIDSGEPQRVGAIHAALLRQGIPMPGRGNEANLIAKIQRSGGRIVRVARGLYGVGGSSISAALVYPDGRRIVLRAPAVRLGRADDNDVILTDMEASRYHAEIRIGETSVTIVDSGSANGVAVNGQRVKSVELHEGDQVVIGSTGLRFTLK